MTAVSEETAITAYFSVAGEISPRRFTWRGATLSVEGVGRRWREGSERCFVVLAAGERPFELRLDERTFRWRISCVSASGPVA
ncbi:MAG: hypothetical protein KKC18_09650 [Chloroflexi bacterium]|nr:hypothetical protein [Chloroflexota bacterium]